MFLCERLIICEFGHDGLEVVLNRLAVLPFLDSRL